MSGEQQFMQMLAMKMAGEGGITIGRGGGCGKSSCQCGGNKKDDNPKKILKTAAELDGDLITAVRLSDGKVYTKGAGWAFEKSKDDVKALVDGLKSTIDNLASDAENNQGLELVTELKEQFASEDLLLLNPMWDARLRAAGMSEMADQLRQLTWLRILRRHAGDVESANKMVVAFDKDDETATLRNGETMEFKDAMDLFKKLDEWDDETDEQVEPLNEIKWLLFEIQTHLSSAITKLIGQKYKPQIPVLAIYGRMGDVLNAVELHIKHADEHFPELGSKIREASVKFVAYLQSGIALCEQVLFVGGATKPATLLQRTGIDNESKLDVARLQATAAIYEKVEAMFDELVEQDKVPEFEAAELSRADIVTLSLRQMRNSKLAKKLAGACNPHGEYLSKVRMEEVGADTLEPKAKRSKSDSGDGCSIM